MNTVNLVRVFFLVTFLLTASCANLKKFNALELGESQVQVEKKLGKPKYLVNEVKDELLYVYPPFAINRGHFFIAFAKDEKRVYRVKEKYELKIPRTSRGRTNHKFIQPKGFELRKTNVFQGLNGSGGFSGGFGGGNRGF